MKKNNYSKAIRILEEENLEEFLQKSNIKAHFDPVYGVVLSFPEEAENYTYLTFGKEVLYVCLQMGNELLTFGHMR